MFEQNCHLYFKFLLNLEPFSIDKIILITYQTSKLQTSKKVKTKLSLTLISYNLI